MQPIVIVDYGMGNLGSVLNMLKRVGAPAIVSGERRDVEDARKLILPGVGAFGEAMARINASGLREVLDRKAKEGQSPILGICLGMQLLTRGSEEGGAPGLGWIAGEARRFPPGGPLKVPHMGWNSVRATRTSALIEGLDADARFYFVHSYFVAVDRPEDTLLKTTYGQEFDSAIQSSNIYGAQFHPEKSHRFGKQFLSNFAALPC
jgi:glutamine amidotransferase